MTDEQVLAYQRQWDVRLNRYVELEDEIRKLKLELRVTTLMLFALAVIFGFWLGRGWQ